MIDLPVQIGGQSYELEALVGQPAAGDRPAPYPVILFTHGAPGQNNNPKQMTTQLMRAWVIAFAERGYLAVAVMRRGFGRSTGERYVTMGTCAEPDPLTYLQGQADDLAAVLEAIATWPEADLSRVVGVGHSAGGAAMLALASRTPDVPLQAIVNVAGGLYRFERGARVRRFHAYDGCERYATALIDAMGELGEHVVIPSLWLYAENDPFFRPDFVDRLHTAWKASEVPSELVFLPPYQPDGHKLFLEAEGRNILLTEIETFLRANGR